MPFWIAHTSYWTPSLTRPDGVEVEEPSYVTHVDAVSAARARYPEGVWTVVEAEGGLEAAQIAFRHWPWPSTQL